MRRELTASNLWRTLRCEKYNLRRVSEEIPVIPELKSASSHAIWN